MRARTSSRNCVCAYLIAMSVISLVGCREPRTDVERALRDLAPQGGTGEKAYFYQTGELKERVQWASYQLVSRDVFDKSGTLVHSQVFDDRISLAVELDETGAIELIAETQNHDFHGTVIRLENECVTRTERWSNGHLITSADRAQSRE